MSVLWKGLVAGAVVGAFALPPAHALIRQETTQPSVQEDGDKDLEVNEVSNAYRVGPGDVLDVAVFGEPDLTRLVTVQHGGEITFPLLGDIQVVNLTLDEVQNLLRELLAKDYLVDPQITLKVKEFRSQWVTVVGEIARPGKYFLDGPRTLLEILTEAGGFTSTASGEVVVTRLESAFEDGSNTRHVLLSQDMSATEQSQALSLVLESGDLVTVSGQAFIYISGEVRNPGSYPLTPGLTVLKAVSLSGGLGKFGSKGKVEILRKNGSGKPERIKVDLGEIEKGKVADVALVPGDIVKVGKRVF